MASARRHRLAPDRTRFLRQSDAAIQGGAFHNDVVAVANQHVLFTHEIAFHDREAAHAAIRAAFPAVEIVEVPAKAVSLGDAIRSYLFNAQLVRSEEHTSELQSLMRISYAVFCLKKKN